MQVLNDSTTINYFFFVKSVTKQLHRSPQLTTAQLGKITITDYRWEFVFSSFVPEVYTIRDMKWKCWGTKHWEWHFMLLSYYMCIPPSLSANSELIMRNKKAECPWFLSNNHKGEKYEHLCFEWAPTLRLANGAGSSPPAANLQSSSRWVQPLHGPAHLIITVLH